MKLAIALPLWNRVEFVRETIPALKAARGFSDIPVVAAFDGPLKDIPGHMRETYRRGDIGAVRKFVLSALSTPKFHRADVLFWRRDENVGMSDNIMSSINKAFLLYEADAVICVEDDVLVSRDFITFIRACLERYRDTKSVIAVSADCEWCGSAHKHKHLMGIDFSAKAPIVAAAPWWMTIGWAIWRDRWGECYDEYKEFKKDPIAWTKKMHAKIESLYPACSLRQIIRPLFKVKDGIEMPVEGIGDTAWATVLNIIRVANQQVIVEPRASRTAHIGWYGRNMNFELAKRTGSTKETPWRRSICFNVDWHTEDLELQFPTEEEVEHKGRFQGLA